MKKTAKYSPKSIRYDGDNYSRRILNELDELGEQGEQLTCDYNDGSHIDNPEREW